MLNWGSGTGERLGDSPGKGDRHGVSLLVQDGAEVGGTGGEAQPDGTSAEWPVGSSVAPKPLGASGEMICKVRNEEHDCFRTTDQVCCLF